MSSAFPESKKTSATGRIVKLSIKIAITVICFWYVSTKIDFAGALKALTQAKLPWLLIALFFFILSKIFSSMRLNIYFRNIGLTLPEKQNLKLYWFGMFYNLFLPGAISGDAYKVIQLNRKYGTPYKKGSAAVLLDRFSGVTGLAFIFCFYTLILPLDASFDIIVISSTILGTGAFYLAVRFIFRDFLPGFIITVLWGIAVQAAQVLCIYCLMYSLGISPGLHEWIFIFLASAMITILPVSLGGGLGTRELVFTEGALFFSLDPKTGVVISLLFYLITVAGSLGGLYYHFKDPLTGKTKQG